MVIAAAASYFVQNRTKFVWSFVWCDMFNFVSLSLLMITLKISKREKIWRIYIIFFFFLSYTF